MGMSPTAQRNGAELVIDELYRVGSIDEKIFSIQVGDLFEPSKITIGGYDTEKYAKENITWHELSNKQYWTIDMESVHIGEQEIELSTNKVIVDSGTSYLLMPTDDFRNFAQYFLDRTTCWIDSNMYNLFVCNCDANSYQEYPDLVITIDGHQYTLTK